MKVDEEVKGVPELKSIFQYTNYRDFLKDAYHFKKSQDKKFSFPYFSKLAGFKSCSVLKMVIDGQRNIAPHSIDRFAFAFKLNKEETQYFRLLVMLNQAKTGEEKQKFAEEIFKLKKYKKLYPLKESQYNYFARWYFTVIWEMVSLDYFREDCQWIASKIYPTISPQEVKRAIEELIKLGLLGRNDQGTLIKTEAALSTPDEVVSSAVAQFHREMIKRAGESIERIPREKRDISGFTFPISLESAKIIKEMVQNFRKELAQVILQQQSLEAVYQLNFQFFPLVSPDNSPQEAQEKKK